jgi:hypothetical protein
MKNDSTVIIMGDNHVRGMAWIKWKEEEMTGSI